MNLFKKIGIAVVGMAMAVGVGVAVGSNRETVSAHATDSTYIIGWGTASGASGTYSNFTSTSGSVTNILSWSSAKNSSGSAPAYNSSNSELRLYYNSGGDGGSVTIEPEDGVTFTGFVMTTSTTPTVKYSVDGGALTAVSASNNTYTVTGISATSSLVIQNCNTTNTQLRIKTISLSYTSAAGGKTIEVTNVTITNGDVELGSASVGQNVNFSATVTYKTGDEYKDGAGTVTWASSKSDVATIDADTGVATIVGKGDTIITATATDGGNPSASVTLSIEKIVLPSTFTILGSDFGTMSYTTTLTHAYSGLNDLSDSSTSVTIKEVNCLKNGNNLQSNNDKGSSVSNTTPIPGRISTIVVTFTASGKNSTTLYLANGSAATTSSTNTLSGSSSDAIQTFEVSSLGNFNYFLFDLNDVTGAVYFTIKVNYEQIPASLSLKKNGVEVSEASIFTGENDNSVTLDIACDNFGVGSIEFSKSSSNTTILPLANIVFDGATVTITSGSTPNVAGITVTITGSLNGKVASDTILIKIMPSVDDLIGIEVTNNPDKTSYNTGEFLDLTGLVVTATYDDGAEGIEADVTNECTFSPAEGTEITSEMSKVTVTYHGETAEISLIVTVVVNYVKATSMNQIFDGQVVVLANLDGTAVTKVYDGSSNNVKAAVTTPVAGKITSANLASVSGVTYTLQRVNYDSDSDGTIDSTAWLLNDGTYYLYSAGTATSGKNYMKGKTVVDSDCYWQISFVDSALQIKSVNNEYTPYIRFNSTLFSCYNGASAQSAIAFYVLDADTTGASAAKSFNDNYMHMDKNVEGQCNTYYPIAKTVWNDLETSAREKFIENHSASYERLGDWAAAKGDSLNVTTHALEAKHDDFANAISSDSSTTAVATIVITSVISLAAFGGYFFLRRRKEI